MGLFIPAANKRLNKRWNLNSWTIKSALKDWSIWCGIIGFRENGLIHNFDMFNDTVWCSFAPFEDLNQAFL